MKTITTDIAGLQANDTKLALADSKENKQIKSDEKLETATQK